MIFGAAFAFVMPLGIGILAAGADAITRATPGLWGTIPQWIQAIGVPAAIFGTVWVAQTTAREARRKESREQLALTHLALRYGEKILETLDAAIAAYHDYPTRIGEEMFENHQNALTKFPVEKVHEVEVALQVHELAIAVSFFRPRYRTLYRVEPESPEANDAMEKLRGSRASAASVVEKLRALHTAAASAAARQGGWLEDADRPAGPSAREEPGDHPGPAAVDAPG